MIIKIEVPDHLSKGRCSSLKKGIMDGLYDSIDSSPIGTSILETPEGHEKAREEGRLVGLDLAKKIDESYKQ
mgnify:CR=1 FL=1